MKYKKGSTFGAFVLVLLLFLLGYLIYLLYLNLPRDQVEFKTINRGSADVDLVEYSSSNQFYNSMRYQDKIITYEISGSCDDGRKQDMMEAFSVLEEKTVLAFVSSDIGVLQVLCSDIAPEAGQEDYFVAGEGGPSQVINSTLYSVILEGKISLFREEKCSESKIAIHELLHALGFDHNNNPNSILYPTLNCGQEIDESVINDINNIYSVEPLPDFKIFRVQASKGGKYLNFEIEVLNQGIIDGRNVKMTLYQGDEKVQDFELNEIEIGARKILTVENLRLPSLSGNKISFVVDPNDLIPELSESNNRVELVLTDD